MTGQANQTEQAPVALYVHVPFCRQRCGYCNFSLVAGRDHLVQRYLDAIALEVGLIEATQPVTTVFLGGGTPSHLDDASLHKLVEICKTKFVWGPDVEFSVECNPEDLSEQKRDTLAAIGVNRISFGVQSFSADKLQFLERDHRLPQIETAFELAKSLTENISFDLIFATPKERSESWRHDLQMAIDFAPPHLSTYELTIEKGTQFWNREHHGSLSVPEEDRRLDLYLETIETLSVADYQHYEISSFAKTDHRCKHNQVYWQGHDYYAFGPGAASYVAGVRRVNHRSTMAYMNRLENNQSPVIETETLSAWQQTIDMVAFGLRQIDGISLSAVQRKTGCDLKEASCDLLEKQQQLGLLEVNQDTVRLTRLGLTLYDSVADQWLTLADEAGCDSPLR